MKASEASYSNCRFGAELANLKSWSSSGLQRRKARHADQRGRRAGAAEVAFGDQGAPQEIGEALLFLAGRRGQGHNGVQDARQVEVLAELGDPGVGEVVHAMPPIAS